MARPDAINVVRSSAAVIAVGYLCLLVALFVASYLTQSELTGLLRSSLVLALLPSVLFFALANVAHPRWLAWILIAPVVGFVIAYGPFLVPRAVEDVVATEDSPSVTFLTWNLQHQREDLDEMVATIREADADVVALQELSVTAADHLARALADSYPHQILHPSPDDRAGTGLLSRHSVVEQEYWHGGGEILSFGHVRAKLALGPTGVTVYSVHPVPPFSLEQGLQVVPHSRQLAAVLARAEGEEGPVVLLGDFNMTDQFDEYRRITDSYTDAYRAVGEVGPGFTFPDGKRLPVPSLLRLDYIFSNDHWQPASSKVIDSSASSDHHPVWARLTLIEDLHAESHGSPPGPS